MQVHKTPVELRLAPLAKEQLDISAPAPMSVRSQHPGLDGLPGFLVLTTREPAGCCALVGHALTLGQGQPCVFMLPEGIVYFFLINWCLLHDSTFLDSYLMSNSFVVVAQPPERTPSRWHRQHRGQSTT